MKIERLNGCTSDSILIDGKHIEDVDQKALLDYLLSKIPEHIKDGTMQITDVIDLFHYDDWEHQSYCDQCNDDVYKTTWII